MPARMSEGIILLIYPFREVNLVVNFFRRARRPKSNFGSGLDRLSHATVSYFQKENRELIDIRMIAQYFENRADGYIELFSDMLHREIIAPCGIQSLKAAGS